MSGMSDPLMASFMDDHHNHHDHSAVQALKEGCTALKISQFAAPELVRYYLIKRAFGKEACAFVSCSSVLDQLQHWMLLETEVRDAVEELVGKVWHTQKTPQQTCEEKMARRCGEVAAGVLLYWKAIESLKKCHQDRPSTSALFTNAAQLQSRIWMLETMAARGWSPRLELWEEPETMMHKISRVTIELPGTQERETTTFTCFGNDFSIADVKQHLSKKGYLVHQVVSHQRRDDGNRHAQTDVADGSHLRFTASCTKEILQIFVRMLGGKTAVFQVPNKPNCVEELKALIAERADIPPEEQRLVHHGKPMDGPWALQNYNLLDESDVDLLLRLRGC